LKFAEKQVEQQSQTLPKDVVTHFPLKESSHFSTLHHRAVEILPVLISCGTLGFVRNMVLRVFRPLYRRKVRGG